MTRATGLLLVAALTSGCFDFGAAEQRYCAERPGFCDGGWRTLDGGPCPARFPRPDAGGCQLFDFGRGLPEGLQELDPLGDAVVAQACGMYRVSVQGSHDLWNTNTDAVRFEVEAPLTGRFELSAWFHGSLERDEQFVATYARVDDRWAMAVLTSLGKVPSAYWVGFTKGESTTRSTSVPLNSPINEGRLSLARTDVQPSRSTYRGSYDTGLTRGDGLLVEALDAGQQVGFAVGDYANAGNEVYVDYLLLCRE